jgi:hypothetical protein
VNADNVSGRELLHQKEVFFVVVVHAAHAKQTDRRAESRHNRNASASDSQFLHSTNHPKYADLAYARGVPEFHAEPYLHLAGLSHTSALIAWGAFYFKTRSRGQWKLVDDRDLRHVHPPRRESIGARSDPYGPARVNVYDELSGSLVATAFTEASNYCWIAGLAPNTNYRYEVLVKGEPWGADERWDWRRGDEQGLVQRGGRYVNHFRTHPDPTLEPDGSFTFIVLGDFGTGILRSTPTRRQFEVAQAMQLAFEQHDIRMIVTTGDNIYAGRRILGMPIGATGDEDDDWFFTFFQPYRYMLNRIPVYPCIGNHDAAETEERDDREQLLDNLFLRERVAGDEFSGPASVEPGLFYRFRYGRDVDFICIDTSKEDFFKGGRLFEYPTHWQWVEHALGRTRRHAGKSCSATIRRSAPGRIITIPIGWTRCCRSSRARACASCSRAMSTTFSTPATRAPTISSQAPAASSIGDGRIASLKRIPSPGRTTRTSCSSLLPDRP